MFPENFLLTNETGRRLYRTCAETVPIIDFHCHLLPEEICEDRPFRDLGEIWLAHDHYKWRAMRAFGIEEKYITGDASYREKFLAFANILPELAGNPLHLWCALELKRYFDVDEPLGPDNAPEIFERTSRRIAEKHLSPRRLIEISNVEALFTTEDPVDSLAWHRKLRGDASFGAKISSAFRPDRAFYAEKRPFPEYLKSLSAASGIAADSFDGLFRALEARLEAFREIGCTLTDHGIESLAWADAPEEKVERVFQKAACGEPLEKKEIDRYRSAFLVRMGRLCHKHGLVMQLHVGTYQGANRRMEREIGVSTGFDGTDDNTAIRSVGELLNRLVEEGSLPRTILYPLDPSQIETFAVLAASFCEGGTKAKVHLGAPWWFNDQPFGIRRQFEAAGCHFPVALSAGMVTDSRSFLSYPRHEVYRRVLCDWLGSLVERGEYFSGEEVLKNLIEKVCFRNAREYFGQS